MTKEEATMIGFEIVAYSGDARSKLLLAIEKAKTKQFNECQALIDQANECLNDAHRAQTELLQLEARGESIEIGFITLLSDFNFDNSKLSFPMNDSGINILFCLA